ncbi:MAG: hypothetical protein Q7J07_07830 [Pelolinea sp.]|nr:hypothetical protein [Pelolinea sp.]
MYKKRILIIGIELILALLHIIGVGRHSNQVLYTLSASYFSDLALPFGFYFLFVLNEEKVIILQKWWAKAGIIFLMATLSGVGQYFGLYVLGRTFDPIDISVYALGVFLAVCFDWMFSKVFHFWKTDLKRI